MMLMKKRILKSLLLALFLFTVISRLVIPSEFKPPEAILPEDIIKIILNEVSGQLPFNNEVMLAGYNHIRTEEEFKTFFYEAEYLTKKLREYEVDEVRLDTRIETDPTNRTPLN